MPGYAEYVGLGAFFNQLSRSYLGSEEQKQKAIDDLNKSITDQAMEDLKSGKTQVASHPMDIGGGNSYNPNFTLSHTQGAPAPAPIPAPAMGQPAPMPAPVTGQPAPAQPAVPMQSGIGAHLTQTAPAFGTASPSDAMDVERAIRMGKPSPIAMRNNPNYKSTEQQELEVKQKTEADKAQFNTKLQTFRENDADEKNKLKASENAIKKMAEKDKSEVTLMVTDLKNKKDVLDNARLNNMVKPTPETQASENEAQRQYDDISGKVDAKLGYANTVSKTVVVQDKKGKKYSLPANQLQDAISQGYTEVK